MIEAKIIEVEEDFSKALSSNLGLSGMSSSFAIASDGGQTLASLFSNPTGTTPHPLTTTLSGNSTNIQQTGTHGMSMAAAPVFGFLKGNYLLNTLLNWGESENLIKIVASPKTVIINREQAKINHGSPVLIQGTTTSALGVSTPTTTVQNANISLEVTPTVTNDGSILMTLHISKDLPVAVSGGQGNGVGTRSLDTKVLVDDNSTLVIGGLYQLDTTVSEAGIPYLRNIPLIGFLFGDSTTTISKKELFIFITPKIINMREANA
jgi:type IV pilus assembly protein PilQ